MKSGHNDNEYAEVCELITARIGLEFPIGRRSSLTRNLTLAANAFGYQDVEVFIEWLLDVELDKSQIKKLASFLTISETYFWRESNVYNALTDYILPELFASKRSKDKSIRIWSAGCSTGEEAYSLAIALHKTLPDICEWNIRIMATDINPKSLDKAMKGIYGKWSFRSCPSWLKPTYFTHLEGENWQVKPEIMKMVTFSNLNLTEEIFPSMMNDTQSMDMIFCRNVLMYFTEEWVRKISHNLFRALSTDGWFVVSSCELSSKVFPQFIPVNFDGAILYRKSDKVLKHKEQGEDVFDIEPSFPFVAELYTSGKPLVDNPFMEAITVEINTSSVLVPGNDSVIVHTVEPELMRDAATLADPILEIRLLADQGHHVDALSLCNEQIKRDKLAIGYYSLRASILQEMDKNSEAIASLKQAIYIDPDFIMGHFALANLFIRAEKQKQAKMYFNNVHELIKTRVDEEIVQDSDGLSVKYIKDITIANLQKLR